MVKILFDESSPLWWKFTPLIKLIEKIKVNQCD